MPWAGGGKWHIHFAIIQQHAIHGLNGTVGSLLCLKVHKAIAFGATLITHNLQWQNRFREVTFTLHFYCALIKHAKLYYNLDRNTETKYSVIISYDTFGWNHHFGNITLQDRIFPNAEKVS